MMKKAYMRIAVSAITLVCFLSVPTRSAIVEIAYEAVVTKVSDYSGQVQGLFAIGERWTGTYTYDTAVVGVVGPRGLTLYKHDTPPAGMTIVTDSLSVRTDPENVDFEIRVGTICAIHKCSDAFDGISHNNVWTEENISIGAIQFGFGNDAGVLVSRELPTEPLDLSQWGIKYVKIGSGQELEHYWSISATITSVAKVPEPASVILLSLGGILIRRKHTRACN